MLANGLGLALASVLATRLADAEPSAASPLPTSPVAAPTSAAAPEPAAAPMPELAGLSILAIGGYGASTSSVRGMSLAPYGPSFGLDAGFTFGFGLRLGVYAAYSLGAAEQQHYDPLFGESIDFTAEASSVGGGLGIGWDVPLHFLLLRYALGFGVTSMSWDFGNVEASDTRYGDAKNPNVSFHFAPGAAVLYPRGMFLGGLGFDYLVQANGTIPSGFVGKLFVGVRL
jgi:hypothetical protein